MRFVSHWPLGVPLLFLARYLPTRDRCKDTFHTRTRLGWRSLRCELRAGHEGLHTHRFFRRGGKPLAGGFRKLFAYTATKRWTGTRNATETFEGGCSLLGALGGRMVARVTRPTQRSTSSFTGRGFSTGRLAAGVRRLAGRDRRSHAAFVERVQAYCQ